MTNLMRQIGKFMVAPALIWFAIGSVSFGQQFRQPSVPNVQLEVQPAAAPLSMQNSHQDFVPGKSEGGLGLVPVRPRNTVNGRNDFDQYHPESAGSRTGEQERILEQIRSGNFDNSSSGYEQVRGPQIIRQRYEDGKDQLVRHVMQDQDGNYYNHGPWRLFNRRGEMVASGQFANGAMDGTWERWHHANTGGMFSTMPFTQFNGPFLSTATFAEGRLNGVWVITDRSRRKVIEVSYRDGKRHGTATWWFPNASKMRVINFKNGELDGSLLEWDQQRKLIRNEEYVAGHKVIRHTTAYRPQQKSSENYYLDAKLKLEGNDSWWDGEPSEYVQTGKRFQHGPSMAWYSNGQRKMVGQYRNDVRVGNFMWWHENGQRALTGRYEDGLKVGTWTWWHSNGMKSIEGDYQSDQPIGNWTWWDEDGQVANREEYGDGSESTGELIDPFDSANQQEDDTTSGEDLNDPFGFENSEVEPKEDTTENNQPPTNVPEEIRPQEYPDDSDFDSNR